MLIWFDGFIHRILSFLRFLSLESQQKNRNNSFSVDFRVFPTDRTMKKAQPKLRLNNQNKDYLLTSFSALATMSSARRLKVFIR